MKPEVGMGATYGINGDAYPYTIVEVISDRLIVVQEDQARATKDSDYYGTQRHVYVPDPNGKRLRISLRKNGRWIQVGQALRGWGTFHIGKRRARTDPHF